MSTQPGEMPCWLVGCTGRSAAAARLRAAPEPGRCHGDRSSPCSARPAAPRSRDGGARRRPSRRSASACARDGGACTRRPAAAVDGPPSAGTARPDWRLGERPAGLGPVRTGNRSGPAARATADPGRRWPARRRNAVAVPRPRCRSAERWAPGCACWAGAAPLAAGPRATPAPRPGCPAREKASGSVSSVPAPRAADDRTESARIPRRERPQGRRSRSRRGAPLRDCTRPTQGPRRHRPGRGSSGFSRRRGLLGDRSRRAARVDAPSWRRRR